MRKSAFFTIAVLIVPILQVLFAPSVSASPGWWNDAWTKRRAITITGNHPENYQLLINLPFSDNSIRFLENEDSGLLPYWVESDNGNGMKVWVRRMENSDNTIYVYYGNPGATLQSSIEDTFIAIVDNLIGAWGMDENTGTNFYDSSGDGHTGEMLGSSWATGKFGSGHAFNGSSSKDKVESFNSGLSGSFTISLWVKPNSVHVGALFNVHVPSYNDYWTCMTIHESQKARVCLYDGSNFPHVYSTNTYTVGGWNHFVMVRDTGADNLLGYLNNTAIPSVSDTTTSVPNYQYILLGVLEYSPGNYQYYFSGSIDEVLVFSRALSSSEVSLLYSYYAYSTTNYPHTVLIRRGYALPTISIGEEEELSGIYITIGGDNLLLDRDVDTPLGAVTSTRLQADVEWQSGVTGVVKENTRFVLKDKNGTVVDNQPATENQWLADNRQRFFRTFHLTDYSIADNALGTWTVRVEVWASSFGAVENSCLTVDDLTTTVSTENLPGHKIKAYGTASRVSGLSLSSLDNAQIADTYGTYVAEISGVNWENTWNPAESGSFVVYLKGGVWDGKSENKPYAFPNLPPSVSVSVSPSLVDRDQDFSGSGASTTATFTITASDQDNDNLTFCLLLYDNAGTLRENVEVGGTYAYDPPDNLPDAALGGWVAEVVATDPCGGEGENTTGFTVDDLTSTANTENLPGHRLRAYGTASRISGLSLSSLNNAQVVDTYGTYTAQVSGTGWENTWSPPENGSFVVYLKSGAWDGKSENKSYVFPNFSPSITSVSVSPNLIDRKKDAPESSVSTSTAITTNATDPDNDTVSYEVRVYDNTYTLRFTGAGNPCSYDPDDNLPDSALRTFRATVRVYDNWGENLWENAASFFVDDAKTSWNFSPPHPYYLWEENISGTISKVSGNGVENILVVFWEKYLGTRTQMFSGNNWSFSFEVKGKPLENVPVRVKFWDNEVDGASENSYIVHENYKYRVWFRWENAPTFNYVENSYLSNENFAWKLSWYATNYSYIIQTLDPATNPLDWENPTQPEFLTFTGDTTVGSTTYLYSRAYYVKDRKFVTIYPVPKEDVSALIACEITLEDPFSRWGYAVSGRIGIYLYENQIRHYVVEDAWDAMDKIFTYLIGGKYYFAHLWDEKVLDYGRIPALSSITISPEVLTPRGAENISVLFKDLNPWWAFDSSDNSLTIFLNYPLDSLTIKFTDLTTGGSTTFYADNTPENYSVSFLSDPTHDYLVNFEGKEANNTFQTEWVCYLFLLLSPSPPPSITGIIGSPVPVVGLGTFFLTVMLLIGFHGLTVPISLTLLSITLFLIRHFAGWGDIRIAGFILILAIISFFRRLRE